jgi:class 3 adenylate cyclase
MITSKDIIERAGISRATLNNYIKLGILPKPIVGPPPSDSRNIKQIGYFPNEAIARIDRVKLLKSRGRSMNEIARFFQEDRTHLDSPSDSAAKTAGIPSNSKNTISAVQEPGAFIRGAGEPLKPSLLNLCVLRADLQDTDRISDELPPWQYFALAEGLWESAGPVIAAHNGLCGVHPGDGLLCYFRGNPAENHIVNGLDCALELRAIMKKFSWKWKEIKGWSNDLYLNIGISAGREFFGTIMTGNGFRFFATGDTVKSASVLSAYARNGGIWATKNLLISLSPEERAIFRFGVDRKKDSGGFIYDCFVRLSDLVPEDDNSARQLYGKKELAAAKIRERLSPAGY